MEKRPGTADTGRKLSFTEAAGNGGYVPVPVIRRPVEMGTQRQVWTTSTQRAIAISKCRGTDLQACGRNGTVIAEPMEFQMAKTPAAKPAKAASAAVKAPRNSDALQKPLTPSAELAVIVGTDPLSRGQVVAKVWEYIKKHNLQDAAKRTMINADAKLKEIFKKAQVSMFEMTKLINNHLS